MDTAKTSCECVMLAAINLHSDEKLQMGFFSERWDLIG